MNYFRCTVGGSGKGNTVTVTCAEEFAGLTITLSKTGKTYTKTCPSTAPYTVTFNGVENGTYTVSCTVDGETYSTEVIVQDISAVLYYGFNWQTWVDTASQLDSSDYDTLDEVLEDELALRELFLEHACVDYMASVGASNEDLEAIIENNLCAKWINLSDYALDYLYANEVIADLMDEADKYFYGEWVITDSTTTPPTWGPKGNVPKMTSNTAPYGTASAYQVFDGNASTTASGTNFSYKFTNPICPKDFFCNVSGGTLQASNDGSTWDTPTSGSYYLYLRLHFESSVSPHTIQFYGRELKVSVPTMTSDTAPYGEVITDPSYTYSSSSKPYMAFDKNNSNAASVNPARTEASIGYAFTSPVIIKKAFVYTSTTVTSYQIQYSDDKSTWVNASAVETTLNGLIDIFDTIGTHRYWRCVRNSSSAVQTIIHELNFYGLDYSEKEFEAGTTKKWLYDHGLELEPLEIATVGSNTVIKDNNSIKFNGSGTNYYAGVITSNKVSGGSLMRIKLGDDIADSNVVTRLAQMSISAEKRLVYANSTTNYLAFMHIEANNAPNNAGLDISSIADSNYAIAQIGTASTSTTWRTEITEWWLE